MEAEEETKLCLTLKTGPLYFNPEWLLLTLFSLYAPQNTTIKQTTTFPFNMQLFEINDKDLPGSLERYIKNTVLDTGKRVLHQLLSFPLIPTKRPHLVVQTLLLLPPDAIQIAWILYFVLFCFFSHWSSASH